MLNFLTSPSGVAICRNLPYNGSASEKPKERLPKRKIRGSRNVYSRKTLEKPKRGSANIERKGSGVVYA